VVPVDREYDIILTHGGYVGRNHYQLGKACCNAMPAVSRAGPWSSPPTIATPNPSAGRNTRP
jgi:hypothetical protein